MTQQEVIQKFMKSLDTTSKKGSAALDAAIKACSPFSSFKELKAALIRDCKNAKSADDFLKTYCGIDYSTEDNGAITGSDAGGSTTKTDESVVPESGSFKSCNKNSFKVNGLTVKLGDGKTYKKLTASEKFIWDGLYTWWIKGALNLIAESYGDNFSYTNKSATVKEISISFYNENSDTFARTSSVFDDDDKASKTTLYINVYHWNSLKNNLTKANTDFDRTIAHEMTHAIMHANIDYYAVGYLPGFIKEGLCELTGGVEKKWETGTYSLKNLAANPSLLESTLNVNNTGTLEESMYSGGYIFFRYLARQAGDLTIENSKSNTTIRTFYGNDSIESESNKTTIISGAGNDEITVSGGSNVSINSGTGADYVAVGSLAKKVTISSGTGNDYINNWSSQANIKTAEGSDTVYNSSLASSAFISSGSGNDSIDNSGAKVTINGGTGNDQIHNYGNTVSIVGGTGNDSVWSYGSKTTINGGSGNDYLANWGDNVKISGGSGNDRMWGDSGNDSLKGDAGNDRLYGEAGNDTLRGGTGNDSLWGGDGKDTFYYAKGDGKDVIFGFENNDLLKITGTFSTSYSKSKGEVYFKVGTTSKAITLSDFTATTFHVNSSTYKISGSKLVKK